MSKKCIGCGAVLQNTDKNKNGYTPKLENKYCMRCFRIANYGDFTATRPEKDNEKIISIVNSAEEYCFFLVDATNISREVIAIYDSIKTRKCLLLTKIDLLPLNIKVNNYLKNFKNIYHIKEEVYSLSSLKKVNINKILKIMDDLSLKKAYVLGCTNAGKSTLINTMLNNPTITTSRVPNTTLDFINLYIEDKILTDTPGFSLKETPFTTDKKYLKKLDYKERIKPLTYQTKETTNIVIENTYRLANFGLNSITSYFNNNIEVKRDFKSSDEYFEVKIMANTDIVIKDLGFINVKRPCNLRMSKNLEELVEFRPSLIGGQDE